MNGKILRGAYHIVETVYKGNFSAVHKARDERFPSRPAVAIKEMSNSQLSPGEKAKALQDFRNEAGLLMPLKHPNLPHVSDFFVEGEQAYLVMEFIEGKTLAKVQVEQHGLLDERIVIAWALQLCTVLHYLHVQPYPIIFRDMKPTNVMVTANGEIKLIDFGITRLFKGMVNREPALLGSRSYAPLEQYSRGQSDARSDVYALGATLYHLLTKEAPIDAPSRRMNPTFFVSPRQLNPSISPAIETVILKAMAQDPVDRYQTMAGMYRAITATGQANPGNPLASRSGVFPTLPTPQPTTNPSGPLASRSGVFPPAPTPQPTTNPSGPLASRNGVFLPAPTSQPTTNPRIRSTVPLWSPSMPGNTPEVTPDQSPSSTGGRTGQHTQKAQRTRRTRRSFLIGTTVAGAAIIGGTFFFLIKNANSTLNLNFTYSAEKQTWINGVINDFNNSNIQVNNKLIQIQGDPRSSGDTITGILNGQLKPAAWSPGSNLELNLLINNWKKQHGSQDIVYSAGEMASQALVLSPLVFAAWKDRSDLLKAKYQTLDWPSVHDALQLSGWSSIGGQASWGPVKFGQTRPDSSTSGLLSIVLLAYSFYSQTSQVLSVDKIRNPNFLKYFAEVEDNVQKFGLSSETYLQNEVIVQGPSQYDIVTTNENLVLTLQKAAQQGQHESLIPSYPHLSIVSNHPFAIFTSASQEEQAAAKKFRDFLLDVPQQRKALLSGFRPTNSNVSLHDSISGNPFNDASLGFQVPDQLTTQVQTPGGDVIDELLKQWINKYNLAPTATAYSTSGEQMQRMV